MGQQINFFLHQDDQADFDRLLKTFGDIVILPYYHYDNKVSTIEDTIIRDITKEGRRVYLIRKSEFRNIPLTHIEKFGYWLVDDRTLPIIHFDRCITKHDRIVRGRIYFQPDFVDLKEMNMVKSQKILLDGLTILSKPRDANSRNISTIWELIHTQNT